MTGACRLLQMREAMKCALVSEGDMILDPDKKSVSSCTWFQATSVPSSSSNALYTCSQQYDPDCQSVPHAAASHLPRNASA
jgi:hypothetical protein